MGLFHDFGVRDDIDKTCDDCRYGLENVNCSPCKECIDSDGGFEKWWEPCDEFNPIGEERYE